jgi:glyoxylase-like metal-dependent hydrolase (beta-lactamase superfamily II)
MSWKRVTSVVAVGLMLAGIALANAPLVYSECFIWLTRLDLPVTPSADDAQGPLPGPPAGVVMGGRWRVQQIGPGTWAIGEPAEAPDNYEYLLVGQRRALLIDAGATAQDIHPVLAQLTRLPVTVIPTHLHFDHSNGLRHFTNVAMIDLPELRARMRDGLFHPGRHQVLGSPDGTPPSVFPVAEWIAPDGWLDLGERRVQVLSTPGHTATSLSVHDPASKLLFSGDLMYTTSLYAFMVDSSLTAYATTTQRLLATLPAETTIFGAHCCRSDGPPGPPWLHMDDVRDLNRAVGAILAGTGDGRGILLRRFPVNRQMTLLTFYPHGNR